MNSLLKNIVAIILARGGSKGIPKKNIKKFCGKPLIGWSILQAKNIDQISSIWVSTDDNQIAKIARSYSVNVIKRPKNISKDTSSSEQGWKHAIKEIEQLTNDKIDLVVGIQPTSPIRESVDIKKGIQKIIRKKADSLFAASPIKDFLIWESSKNSILKPVNFNPKLKRHRQELKKQIIENGSFYIFKPKILQKYKNVLSGKVTYQIMEFWKTFEIDEKNDIEFCELIMKKYLPNVIRNFK
tara:strand:- start:861 stop:1583 length:723 start_codon:yes stop_codon:yes gene_type:complete